MKACFGYIRVSTAKQGEGVSLEAQREAIQDFADGNDLALTRWFEEKETAAKGGRPIFSELVRELKRGRAQGLIIHKIDRSARNFADWAKIGELSDAGIDIHFATESLDFRTRGGRLAADIQAVVAADYIRNLREETLKGINGRLKQGLYPFKAPIGYLDQGGGKPKVIDPVRGPLIRNVFDLYASGNHSLRSLLFELGRRGLRNERGRPITKCCLENLLTNPFYCGLIRLKRTGAVYEGVHEPLISTALFDDVQAVRTGKGQKRVTRHNFTYRGLFRCAHCTSAMIPERQKGNVYYRCQKPGCPTTTVREETIETAVWQTLRETKLDKIDTEKLTRSLLAWIERQADDRQSLMLADQLRKLNEKLERLTDALIDRLIDQETFNTRKETLLKEKLRLEEMQQRLAQETPSREHIRWFLELVKNLATAYLIGNPAEKREIAQIATSNRLVSGRSPSLEPSNWLAGVGDAVCGLCGPPERTKYRTTAQTTEEGNDIVDPEHHARRLVTCIQGATAVQLFRSLEKRSIAASRPAPCEAHEQQAHCVHPSDATRSIQS